MHAVTVTSKKRSTQLTQTPTLAESGYKDFEAITWFGVMAPAGTPPAIVQQLNQAINQALQQADTAERLRFDGGDVLGGSVESFQQLLKAEIPRWAKIVKDSGAGLD
jgi:tripartite-type tricarboxylate transporter receptor subunit TctC